jgi:hypothetical protein
MNKIAICMFMTIYKWMTPSVKEIYIYIYIYNKITESLPTKSSSTSEAQHYVFNTKVDLQRRLGKVHEFQAHACYGISIDVAKRNIACVDIIIRISPHVHAYSQNHCEAQASLLQA